MDSANSANDEYKNIIPRHPIQIWVARSVIGMLVIMVISLQLWGAPQVNIVAHGDTTVYTSQSSFYGYFLMAMTVISGCLAFVFFLQRGIFRLFAAALVVITSWLAYTAFFMDTSNHCVTVTPNGFTREVGTVSAPIKHQIDFTNTASLFIDDVPGSGGRKFHLVANATNGGHETQVPICDMMRAALPKIVENATNKRVMIRRSTDGAIIPPALRVEASK